MTHEIGYCLAAALGFFFGMLTTIKMIANANEELEEEWAEWEELDGR